MESKQTRKNPITTISVSQNIITELDETMKKRFSETFKKVNEEFGRVFKQ